MYTKKTADENREVTKRANQLTRDAQYHPNQGETRRKQMIKEITEKLIREFPHITPDRLQRRAITALRTKSNWNIN